MSLPAINLDNITFQELFEEARIRIPQYAKEWTDHNFSDPGITLIELFAWIWEMQIYHLNLMPEKNYHTFLKLIGERVKPAEPSRVALHFEPKPDSKSSNISNVISLSKGYPIETLHPQTQSRIIFELEESICIHPFKISYVFSQYNSGIFNHSPINNKVGSFYSPFGEAPEEGDTIFLGFEIPIQKNNRYKAFEKEIKLSVYTHNYDGLNEYNINSDQPDCPSNLKWEYFDGERWRALTVKSDTTNGFGHSGAIFISWPGGNKISSLKNLGSDYKAFWVRCTLIQTEYETPPRIDTIELNTVWATHGETISGEKASGNGLPFQHIKLDNAPILSGSVRLRISKSEEKWRFWKEVKDFTRSGPEDCHFTVDTEKGLIRFGDGVKGANPPKNKSNYYNIEINSYRIDGGEKGNIPAEFFTHRESFDNFLMKNVRPAIPYQPAESIESAKTRVRRELKTSLRGITAQDLKDLGKRISGLIVDRIHILPEYHPQFPKLKSPGSVTIVVMPKKEFSKNTMLPIPMEGLLKSLRKKLREKMVITTDLSVVGPRYFKISVNATVAIDPFSGKEGVKQRIIQALERFLDPVQGGDKQTGWSFGRSVYPSECYQIIEGVKGVKGAYDLSISVEELVASKESPNSCSHLKPRTMERHRDEIIIPQTGLASSGTHAIFIKD